MPESVSSAKFADIKQEQRHQEVLDALQSAMARPVTQTDTLLRDISAKMDVLTRKDPVKPIDVMPSIQSLASAMQDLVTVLKTRPTSFKIERTKLGLIDRIIAE